MNNLDQLRAKHALDAATGRTFKGANNGEVVKKIPAMIRQNGILGALAFARENAQNKKTDHADVFFAIIDHLKKLKRIDQSVPHEGSLDGFIRYLCGEDSVILRAVTEEAMAYLNYLRRFAKKEGDDGGD